jgi:hypothetical protein
MACTRPQADQKQVRRAKNALRISAEGSRSSFGKLRVRSRLLKLKTGAYSPPRFSAPVLRVLPLRGEQAAHLLFGQLVPDGAGEKAKFLNELKIALARTGGSMTNPAKYLLSR